ncbi:MAG: hypothetical protein HC904_16815 [Blastochloris sp.]|nr:hypothetical protein [Blastochloris sp.]
MFLSFRLMTFTLDNLNHFSLDDILSSGQTFCWRRSDSAEKVTWHGYIYDIPCHARQVGKQLQIESSLPLEESLIRRYFNLHPHWEQLLTQLPDEPWLNLARRAVPGLRCVHEPWWECTANFICSSLKQIPHIAQINQQLRQHFGQPLPPSAGHRFPTPETLAALEEKDLRACKLGYRARHLHRAARLITDRRVPLGIPRNPAPARSQPTPANPARRG